MIMSRHMRGGFSLVEIALALLVASIGLMAVMGMFPMGMESGKKAIDEAQCALFAEEIFNGFRARMGSTNVTWQDLDDLVLGAPAPDMWDNGGQIRFQANSSGTNVYQYKYENTLLDYAVRYVMSVDEARDMGGNVVPGVKYLRLTLWNGEYGSASNRLVFYTEMYDTGRR